MKFEDLETFIPKIEETKNEELKENKETQTKELNFEETKTNINDKLDRLDE